MKITFLGSGSAFVKISENYQSNILITVSEEQESETTTKNLLIDAGSHINESLDSIGLDESDIHAIFLTHNHSDHNGGLEYIGFKTFFTPDIKDKPVLFADTKVLTTLWDDVLQGNMRSINGQQVNLSAYYNVKSVKPKTSFQFLGTVFTPVRMTHVVDHIDEVPSYGLKWEHNDVKFFFSGDTQFDFWRLMPFWEYADVIFQDCEFLEYENSVHAQFHQLRDIPEQYRSKMWLYHYMLYGKTFEELETEVKSAGFAGLVKRGEEFDTNQLKGVINESINQ
jgi:ribonuclease BN (tRNA processing enzyme)